MKKLVICGVGSRETPNSMLNEMTEFGKWVRLEKYTLRSGHAPGADWAFEQGAQERCIAYIPWSSFYSELKSRALKVVVTNQANYNQFTDDYHPAANRLSAAVRKLMNRNACQVLGLNLQKPADVVICWTKDGGLTGGTSQAMRIAQASNIPIFNMYYEKYNTCDKLIDEITLNFLV